MGRAPRSGGDDVSAPPKFGARSTVVVNLETNVLTDIACEVDGKPIPYRRALSAVTRGRPPMFCSDHCMHAWNTQNYRAANLVTSAFETAYRAIHGALPVDDEDGSWAKSERALVIELLKTHDAPELVDAIAYVSDCLGSKFSSLRDLDTVKWSQPRKQKKRDRKAS